MRASDLWGLIEALLGPTPLASSRIAASMYEWPKFMAVHSVQSTNDNPVNRVASSGVGGFVDLGNDATCLVYGYGLRVGD